LAAGAGLFATTGLAGCWASDDASAETATDAAGDTDTPAGDSSESTEAAATVAVAAEWNAMRARLRDALSLGVGGDVAAGASVAQSTFARFEGASGEYGAHEMLEHTSESNYEAFEEALGELRTAGLGAGDIGRAREETTLASGELAAAQRTLVGESTAGLFDLQLLGVAAENAAFLAAGGNFAAAATTADDVLRHTP
jgi:hypothetical protein